MCFENLIFEATTYIRDFNDFSKSDIVLKNFEINMPKFMAFKKRYKDIIKNNVNETFCSKIKLFENSIFEIYIIFWFENCESIQQKKGSYYKILVGELEESIFDNDKLISKNILKKSHVDHIDNYKHKFKNITNHIITDKDKVEYFLDAVVSIHFLKKGNF